MSNDDWGSLIAALVITLCAGFGFYLLSKDDDDDDFGGATFA